MTEEEPRKYIGSFFSFTEDAIVLQGGVSVLSIFFFFFFSSFLLFFLFQKNSPLSYPCIPKEAMILTTA